jgi:hypothetical protein
MVMCSDLLLTTPCSSGTDDVDDDNDDKDNYGSDVGNVCYNDYDVYYPSSHPSVFIYCYLLLVSSLVLVSNYAVCALQH